MTAREPSTDEERRAHGRKVLARIRAAQARELQEVSAYDRDRNESAVRRYATSLAAKKGNAP